MDWIFQSADGLSNSLWPNSNFGVVASDPDYTERERPHSQHPSSPHAYHMLALGIFAGEGAGRPAVRPVAQAASFGSACDSATRVGVTAMWAQQSCGWHACASLAQTDSASRQQQGVLGRRCAESSGERPHATGLFVSVVSGGLLAPPASRNARGLAAPHRLGGVGRLRASGVDVGRKVRRIAHCVKTLGIWLPLSGIGVAA